MIEKVPKVSDLKQKVAVQWRIEKWELQWHTKDKLSKSTPASQHECSRMCIRLLSSLILFLFFSWSPFLIFYLVIYFLISD